MHNARDSKNRRNIETDIAGFSAAILILAGSARRNRS
jgi:hypothetical protein